MNEDYNDTGSIMWPVHGLDLGIEDPHVTCMFLGKFDSLGYNYDDVLDALSPIDNTYFIDVKIIGQDLFGPEHDIPVWLVEPLILTKFHDDIKNALVEVGIRDGSSYADQTYRPHISVGYDVWSRPPARVLLSPLEVWWGPDKIKLS